MKQGAETIQRPSVIIVDVYGTLLDMEDVERRVNDILDSRRGYTLWFELLMEYCFVQNCLSQFHDFSSIVRATLSMIGEMLDRDISASDVDRVLHLTRQLPLLEGVPDGLSLLLDSDVRLAALTNADEATVRERMERTGLHSYFEKIISAEQVKKYKPCAEVYHRACNEMKVVPSDAMMVSVHAWDVAGAANAGMQTAFIRKKQKPLFPLAPAPDMTSKSFYDFATMLNER